MKYLLLIFVLVDAFSQSPAQIPGEQVYIHTDRDVYAPSNAMNFKAYLKNNNAVVSKSSQLFVCLLNPAGKLIVDKILPVGNNQAAGSIVLPDSLEEGEYRLLAYTDQMEKGSPKDAFTRKVFIRRNELQGLLISLKPDASWYVPGDFARLGIHIGFQDQQLYNDDQFTYLASKNGVPFQNGTGKTDKKGNASLVIKIPSDTIEGLITVAVSAAYKKYHGSASVPLPAGGMPVFLNFFPEGGTLIDGLETKVGFQAQDYQGNPMVFKGLILDQDDQAVDSIKSSNLGIGSFRLLPDITDPLKVKITRPAGFIREIPLPVVQAAGVQLILQDRTDRFLGFHVRTTILHADQQLVAVVETSGQILSKIPVILDDTLSFLVPVDGIKGGILRVSLVNKEGTTVAQRSVFFTPPASRIISNNGSAKGKNPEIKNVNIAVVDPNGQPVDATLSLSLSDDIISPDWNREPDIVSWFLLGPTASILPPGYFSNPADIDNNLLDNLMLSRIDTTINWNHVLSGQELIKDMALADFRNRLISLYQPKPFEQLIAQFHNDQFFNEYFLTANNDLSSFIKRNMIDLEEMGIIPAKPTQEERIRWQLENGIPVLIVLRMVKPYTLIGDKIFFRPNKSLMYPKGALFLIDGLQKGNSIEVLNDYSPFDITNIKVSLSSSEILKYDGEAEGLIFITTKNSNNSFSEAKIKPVRKYNPTLYWNPEIRASSKGPVSLIFPRPELKSSWRMAIQGVDSQGNYMEAVIKTNRGVFLF